MSYHNFSQNKPETIEERVCEILGKRHARLAELTESIFIKLKNYRKQKK